MKKTKNEKGLTLIALIITIVILIILASITISQIGDSGEGIVSGAKDEKNKFENLSSKYNNLIDEQGNYLKNEFNPESGISDCTHEWETETIKESTTTEEGTIQYTCKKCGATFTSNLASDGHECDFSIQVSFTAATCEKNGSQILKCSICDETKTLTDSKLGHDYNEKIADAAHLYKAATTNNGTIYYYDCTRCDKIAESKDDTWEDDDKLTSSNNGNNTTSPGNTTPDESICTSHQYQDYYVSDGYLEGHSRYQRCETCGYIDESSKESGLDHYYADEGEDCSECGQHNCGYYGLGSSEYVVQDLTYHLIISRCFSCNNIFSYTTKYHEFVNGTCKYCLAGNGENLGNTTGNTTY